MLTTRLGLFLPAVIAVGCAPPKLPATSIESAVETYACAVVLSTENLPTMNTAQVPPPATAGGPSPLPIGIPASKVTITVSASLAKEGSAGVTVPVSISGKATDTRSTTIAIELTRLPTLDECRARRLGQRPTFTYDQENGEIEAGNAAGKAVLNKLKAQ